MKRIKITNSSVSHSSKAKWIVRFLILVAVLALSLSEIARNSTHPLMMALTKDTLTAAVDDQEDLLTLSHNKTVLVTGGAGFIGSHVAEYCARNLEMRVVVVDDLSGGTLSNVPKLKSVSFVQGDVKDALFLEDLFHRFEFDYVYHLAAYAAIGLSPFIRSFNYRNNMVATAELLNFAVKNDVDCFVFSSSNAVYGEGQLQLETTTPQPEDPYGISKYSSELDIKAAHKTWGLDSVILRLHNVYGPRQNAHDKYRNAIGIFLNQVMQGLPITIFGDGEQTRQFTYIADIAPIIAKSPLIQAARNEIVNLGSDTPSTLNQVAKQVQRVMDEQQQRYTAKIRHVEARKEVYHATVEKHSKANLLFGISDYVPLERGLELTVPSFIQQVLLDSNQTANATSIGVNAVEVLSGVPTIWATDLKQKAKVDIQRSNTIHASECNPSTVAVLISGQLGRFVFRDNQGPLVTSSSWWGCGKPVVDVYIALQRGTSIAKPWYGKVSSPPYVSENITVDEIRDYYMVHRNATRVHVMFVDEDHMKELDGTILKQLSKRKLVNNGAQSTSFQDHHYKSRYRPYSRMFYMRHLAYAMTMQEQPEKSYDVYISQREDAFFLEPTNFQKIGYSNDLFQSVGLSGRGGDDDDDDDDARAAKPIVLTEKWCKFGSISDKIHIGNEKALSVLWGKDRDDFLRLMIRYFDFGQVTSFQSDPYQTEAFLQDLLVDATVNEVDLKRVDMRYVDGRRCVPGIYHRCQPSMTKTVLSNLGINACPN